MGRKGLKVSIEKRKEIARRVASGTIGAEALARQEGLGEQVVRYWAALYRAQGESFFQDTSTNNVYSLEFKLEAVKSYLAGEGSYETVAAKYGLRSDSQLKSWVKMYNNGEDFSQRKMSGGSHMKTSRKTTLDERIQIVKECLANGCNYGESAIKHKVSYQQVRSWIQRYKELGEAGLEDRRGRRKVNQEPRNEVEKLQIEIEQLKHKLYMTEMERDLLKKVEELERKDPCHK